MIDIVISDERTLLLAHDSGDVEDVAGIEIGADGMTTLRLANEDTRLLKPLTPRMLELARGCSAARVAVMRGFEVARSYECQLHLPIQH